MSVIDKLKTYPKQFDLSDIHIRSNQPLAIREGGEIKVFNEDVITREQIESFWKSVLDKSQFDYLINNEYNSFDIIDVIHINNLHTVVPKALFNKKNIKEYLKFNVWNWYKK